MSFTVLNWTDESAPPVGGNSTTNLKVEHKENKTVVEKSISILLNI